MLIPISQFIPQPHPNFPPLMSIHLFSTPVSLFLPCKLVNLYHFSRFHIHALIYDICFSLSDLLYSIFFLIFIFIFYFFKLFMAVLGLHFCARAFSSCGKWGPLFIAVRRPFTVVASLVAEHRLQMRRLSSCGSRA